MHIPNLLTLLMGTLVAGSAMPAGHSHKHSKEIGLDTIPEAIEAISEATQKVGEIVVQRPLGLIKVVSIKRRCNRVAHKIKKGIELAKQSELLNMTAGFPILVATEEFVQVVNHTMTAVIASHDLFAKFPVVWVPHTPIPKIFLDKIVLKDLKKQSKLSKELGEAVMLKVPPTGRQGGQAGLDKIAASFAQAIAVYQNSGTVVGATASEEEIFAEDIFEEDDIDEDISDEDISDEDIFDKDISEDDISEEDIVNEKIAVPVTV